MVGFLTACSHGLPVWKKAFPKWKKKIIFHDPNVLHFEFDFSDIFRPALVLVCLVLQG